MSNYAFVIDTNKQALHPITPAKARKLLNQNKAAVFRTSPFVLILKHEVTNFENNGYELKIHPDIKNTEIEIINSQGEIIWAVKLEHRESLAKKNLDIKSTVIPNIKTRYRQAKFTTHKRRHRTLTPKLMYRIETIEIWIKRLLKYCPITSIQLDLVRFDIPKLDIPKNDTEIMNHPNYPEIPGIPGIEYQQSDLMGTEVREYLVEKWGKIE
jgi:RRXRR protein